jgi:hypothetical protein
MLSGSHLKHMLILQMVHITLQHPEYFITNTPQLGLAHFRTLLSFMYFLVASASSHELLE